jgi:hypothetical protein
MHKRCNSILSKSDGPRSVPAIGVDDRVVMAAPGGFQRPPGGQCSPRRLSGCGEARRLRPISDSRWPIAGYILGSMSNILNIVNRVAAIEFEGRTVTGTYTVWSGMITVSTANGKKVTQVSGSGSPGALDGVASENFVISGGDAPEILEPAEAAFDDVAPFVGRAAAAFAGRQPRRASVRSSPSAASSDLKR